MSYNVYQTFRKPSEKLNFDFAGQISSIKENNVLITTNNDPQINFEMKLTVTGDIIGKLLLKSKNKDQCTNLKNSLFGKPLNLTGQEIPQGFSIEIKDCNMLDFNESDYLNEIQINFTAEEAILSRTSQSQTLENAQNVTIKFGLNNVFRIIDKERKSKGSTIIIGNRELLSNSDSDATYIETQTELGRMTLSNYDGILEQERIMMVFRIPLITSHACIKVSKYENMDDLINQAKEIMTNILKITSLVQTCRHDWSFVIVETPNDGPIFVDLHRSKGIPFFLPLDNFLDVNLYVKLWNGFNNSLDEEFNFTTVLEWYLSSFVANDILMMLLNILTSVECLCNAYHRFHKTDVLVNDNQLEKLVELMKPSFEGFIEDLRIDENRKQELLQRVKTILQESRRRTYRKKLKDLEEVLNIDTSDLPRNIGDVIDTRNKIVHAGDLKMITDVDSLKKYSVEYEALVSLLIRFLLSILGYRGKYYDIVFRRATEIRDYMRK